MAKNEESLECATSTQIENLLSILAQEKKVLAKHHLYKEATTCSNMIAYVSKYLDSSKKKENQRVAKEEFTVIRQKFDDSFKEFDDETKVLERDLILRQRDRLKIFESNQQEELNEFESRWDSDKKIRTYNKCTSDLSTMKSRIPYLLVDSQFEEAEATEKDIEIKTQVEVFDRYCAMQYDYDRALKYLIKKQELDLEQFKTDCDVELEKFREDRKKLRQGFLNRQLKLKAKEDIIDDPDKLWVHSQTERIGNAFNGTNKKNMPLSPSSKMAVSDFRNSDTNTLALPPLKKRLSPTKKI